MLTQLLEKLKEKRPEKLEVKMYGNYGTDNQEAVYNDHNQQYEVRTIGNSNTKVSSVKSFAKFINEELRRRKNLTGDMATAKVTSGGGVFCADDDLNKGFCQFERALSQQWLTLKGVVGKTLSHEEFLLTMQKLRPSIGNFHELYSSLLTVRIIGRSELTSNPIFVGNEAEAGYKCKFKLQSGNVDEAELPCLFACTMPYAKASEKTYELPIELMFLNDGDGNIKINLQCADYEIIEEQAIFDEVEYLKEQTQDLKDLLVLLDY